VKHAIICLVALIGCIGSDDSTAAVSSEEPSDRIAGTWIDMNPPGKIDYVMAGVFLDAKVGFVAGKRLWRTSDGGRTWKKVCEQQFWQLAFADSRVGYACRGYSLSSGKVYKTTDSGITWNEVFDVPVGLMSLAVGDGDHVVVGSPWRPNNVWITGDGGKTWKVSRGAGGDSTGTIIATGATEFFAMNLKGQLARSLDAGKSWKHLAKLEKGNHTGHLLCLTDGTLLFSGSKGGGLQRSTDGGLTFSLIPDSPSGRALYQLADGSILYAAGGGIMESGDDGATWQRTFKTTLAIGAFCQADGIEWAFGGAPGRVGFWPVSLLLRKGPTLPEATTASIIPIPYELKKDGFVTLVIEDPNGVRIRNLIANQPRRKGRHTDYWDGRDEWGRVVAPGPYRWRGLTHTGLHMSYEFAFNTPCSPPWSNRAGTGYWGSDHRNPQAVTVADDKIILG